MKKYSTSKNIISVGAFLIIIAFFIPWIKLPFDISLILNVKNLSLFSLSGFQIAFYLVSLKKILLLLYLVPVFALIVLANNYFIKSKLMHMFEVVIGILFFSGLTLFYFKYQGPLSEINNLVGKFSSHYSLLSFIGLGAWITILGFLLITLGNIPEIYKNK